MNIAFQSYNDSTSNGILNDFNYLCFSALAAQHPEIDFLMLSNQNADPCFITEKNIKTTIVKPEATNYFKTKFLLEFGIPKVLKKHKTDFFFSNNNRSVKNGEYKQIVFVDDLSVLNKRSHIKNISRADYIIVINQFLKNCAEKIFPEKKDNIIVIPGIINKATTPLSFIQCEEVKKEFSGEKDYFLLFAENCDKEKIIVGLKAFSQFKKWQKSSMKLLIAVKDNQLQELQSIISNYKFRDDVVMLNEKSESVIHAVIASSYCLIFPDATNFQRPNIFFGMQSEVPIIVPDSPSEKSSFETAAIFGTENEKILSQNMMLMYKDEETRSAIIQAAKVITNELYPEKIGDIIMERIIRNSVS